MLVHSRLPEIVGEVDPSWRESFDGNFDNDTQLRFASRGSEPEFIGKGDEWLTGYPKLVELVKQVDDDYRQRFGFADNATLRQIVDVRAGNGNISSLHQVAMREALPQLKFLTSRLKKLKASMPHVDVTNPDNLPTPKDPAIFYSLTVGPATEWFPGTFYIPRPFDKFPYIPLMMGITALQVLTKEPRQATDNQLLVGPLTNVHRMPEIDLNEGGRWFFRSYVFPPRKKQRK